MVVDNAFTFHYGREENKLIERLLYLGVMLYLAFLHCQWFSAHRGPTWACNDMSANIVVTSRSHLDSKGETNVD